MFDHIALGIVLPGPITREEKWYHAILRRKTSIRLRMARDASDLQTSQYIIDSDFDDPPLFTLAEPEMPKPPGAEQ